MPFPGTQCAILTEVKTWLFLPVHAVGIAIAPSSGSGCEGEMKQRVSVVFHGTQWAESSVRTALQVLEAELPLPQVALSPSAHVPCTHALSLDSERLFVWELTWHSLMSLSIARCMAWHSNDHYFLVWGSGLSRRGLGIRTVVWHWPWQRHEGSLF